MFLSRWDITKAQIWICRLGLLPAIKKYLPAFDGLIGAAAMMSP